MGTRSPARQKLFKSKYHETAAVDSRLPIGIGNQRQISTSYNGQRNNDTGPLAIMQRSAEGGPRAATTKEGATRKSFHGK